MLITIVTRGVSHFKMNFLQFYFTFEFLDILILLKKPSEKGSYLFTTPRIVSDGYYTFAWGVAI